MMKPYMISRVAAFVPLSLLLLALLLLLTSILAYRSGLLELKVTFSTLRFAVLLLIPTAIGAFVALLLLIRYKGGPLLLGLTVLVLCFSAFALWRATRLQAVAQSVPRIHDITTDTTTPPEFGSVMLSRREGAANPPGYEGSVIAEQQTKAYPDIQPLVASLPPAQVFPVALETARKQGWEIVDTQEPERIEATETTFWFGFKDDVVIRIRPLDTGSIIDVRSKSRVGLSDLGENARRIREYLQDLKGQLHPSN